MVLRYPAYLADNVGTEWAGLLSDQSTLVLQHIIVGWHALIWQVPDSAEIRHSHPVVLSTISRPIEFPGKALYIDQNREKEPKLGLLSIRQPLMKRDDNLLTVFLPGSSQLDRGFRLTAFWPQASPVDSHWDDGLSRKCSVLYRESRTFESSSLI